MRKLLWIFALVWTVTAPQLARADDTSTMGGAGGSPYHVVCPNGGYLIGFVGRVGAWIDQMQPVCQTFNELGQRLAVQSTGPVIGRSTGGAPVSALCPPETVVTQASFNTTLDDDTPKFVQNLSLTCAAPLPPSPVVEAHPELRSDGGPQPHCYGFICDTASTYHIECPAYQLATGVTGRSGDFVDAFGLTCGPSPTPRGRVIFVPGPSPARASSPVHVQVPPVSSTTTDPRLLGIGRRVGQPAPSIGAAPVLAGSVPDGVRDLRGFWQSSEGELTFTQDKLHVEGSYNQSRGRLSGEIRGAAFVGFWVEASSSERCKTALFGSYYWGKATFSFDDATDHFDGTWAHCEAPAEGGTAWTGDLVHR